jgi:hypothetical protein
MTSPEACRAASETHQIAVRGRGEMLTVHVASSLESLSDVPRPVSAA